jgi:hypothetical protein
VLDPVEFFRADLVDSPDMAEGGRAGPDEAFITWAAVLDPRDFDDTDLAGVYVAAADMGRSGTPFAAAAAFALRCSAIFSFNAVRAAPAPTDLEKEGTEA